MYALNGLTARDLRIIGYALDYYRQDGLPSDVSEQEMEQVSEKVEKAERVGEKF